jgi:hypothetical protein
MGGEASAQPASLMVARATQATKLVAIGILSFLFLGALFYHGDALRVHAQYARRVVTDDATRADAKEYVNARVALLPQLLADIRESFIIPMLHVCVGITAFFRCESA